MRIIFHGLFTHAMQLLADFEKSIGMNDDFKTITSAIAKMLPEIKFSIFSGDVVLPEIVALSTMYLRTYENSGLVRFHPTVLEADVKEFLSLVTESSEFLFTLDGEEYSFSLPSNAMFKAQPDFKYNTLEFVQHIETMDDKKGTWVTLWPSIGYNGVTVWEVRIGEKAHHGQGWRFGRRLAKMMPQLWIIYHAKQGVEGIHRGFDWNKGYPRFLATDAQRDEFEQQLQVESAALIKEIDEFLAKKAGN